MKISAPYWPRYFIPFLTLLLGQVSLLGTDEDFYHEAQRVRAWIPDTDTLPVVRGILLAGNGAGSNNKIAASNPLLQDWALRHGFVVMGTAAGNLGEADAWNQFLSSLNSVINASGRLELHHAPVLYWGHSMGGQQAYGMARRIPDRMIAFIVNKGANYVKEAGVDPWHIPALIMAGENDSDLRRNNIRNLYLEGRAEGAPWVWMEEYRQGHGVGNSMHIAFGYFEEILPLRYPHDPANVPTLSSPPALQPVVQEDGWLVKTGHPEWSTGFAGIFPQASYTGDPLAHGWVPNRRFAYLYRALASYVNPNTTVRNNFGKYFVHDRPHDPRVSFDGETAALGRFAPGEPISYGFDLIGNPNWTQIRLYSYDELLHTIPASANHRFDLELFLDADAPSHAVHMVMDLANGEQRTSFIHFFTPREAEPLAFARPPQDSAGFAGETVRLQAAVTGTGPVSYQWFQDGAPIVGANDFMLELSDLSGNHAGSYTLQVDGPNGQTLTSDPVTVHVGEGSTVWRRINFQLPFPPPPRGWLADGGDLYGPRVSGEVYGWLEAPFALRQRFSTAPPAPSFRHDSLAIMRGSSWAMEVPNGKYRVRLVAGDPEFPTGVQSFTLNGQPLYSISTDTSQVWADGETTVWVWENQLRIDPSPLAVDEKIAFLEIERIYEIVPETEAVITATPESGLLPLEVDFSVHRSRIKTGESLQGATWDFGDGSPTATGENVTHIFTDPGDFTVTLALTDTAGGVSTDSIILSVGVPLPGITTHPEPQTLPVGGTLTLATQADGYGTLVYQWTRNGDPLAGQESATLTISNAQTADAGLYRLKVTNAGGTAESHPAEVVVIPAPGVPENLVAVAQGSSQVRLSWDEPDIFTDAIIIQRAGNPGGPWTTIATVERAFTTFNDTNLDPITTYHYRILGKNPFFESDPGNVADVTTDNVPGSGWTFTLPITIDGYAGTEDLEDFPVLVRFEEAFPGFSFADFGDPLGGDLRFVNAGGTRELAFEIDYWNENGSAAVWVRVPEITAGGDTVIHALWGNGDAIEPPAYATNGSVWEGNYRAVWHLQETEGERRDSTSFLHHAVPAGPLLQQPGVVGSSARFDGSNGNTSLSVGAQLRESLKFTNQFTLEGWMRIDAGAGTQYRFAYTVGDPYWTGSGYRVDFNTARMRTSIGTASGVDRGNAREVHDTDFPGGVPEETWFHFAVVWNGAQISTYFNGQHAGTESFPHTIDYPSGPSAPLVLGAGIFGQEDSINRSLAGNLDEMRISDRTKSADWIAATYKNILHTDEFLTLGPVGTTAPAPAIIGQPQGMNLQVGDAATFAVVASGEEPLQYQWQKNGVDIPGATSATYTLDPVGVASSGSYRVIVSNVNGSTPSAEALLSVSGTVPTIIAWPTASPITFGQSLADAALSGGSASVAGSFSFVDLTLIPPPGTTHQTVLFQPANDFTYETVQGTVPVEVVEASASVFLSSLTVTYNGQAQSPTVATVPEGLSYALTFDGLTTAPVNAGTYAVTATITEEGATGSATATFTIEPALLTVRANDAAKFEGEADPVLSWSLLGGQLLGDDSLSGSLARTSGESVGTYTITQGTLSASANYTLLFLPGTFAILEAGEAPWVLQSNFDELNPGPLRGQDGWSGNNDNAAQVIQDPQDAADQVFRFAPGNNNNIARNLSTPIQPGEVATLFFRFYVPSGMARINQQIRMPGNTPIRLKWDSDPSEPVFWLYGEDMSAASQQQIDQPIARNTWYSLWMVIDNANGHYRLYLQGGDFNDQTFVTVANMGTDPNTHPFQTGLIDALYFIGWNNGPMLYDDFYLAHGAENLSNPTAITPPGESFHDWMEGFAHLTPAEREPLSNPTGDGLPNLLKYALDLDPTVPATGIGGAIIELVEEGGARVIEARIPADLSRPGLHYVLEISDDLATWSPLAEAIGHTAFTATPGAPVSAVGREGDTLRVALASAASNRAFYRLTVTALD
ncbi:MAG: DUF2341 domain-containing protein [Opitutales bacterium]|nr:DUF2341 domain-containing protein [Opitutales bacterium]